MALKRFLAAAGIASLLLVSSCQQQVLNEPRPSLKRAAAPQPQTKACVDGPFRCELEGAMASGWYFVVAHDTVEPRFAITVAGGAVTGDYSEDQYGCMGRSCDQVMFSTSGRNLYRALNDKQISRRTPDGREYVLTWFKPLD